MVAYLRALFPTFNPEMMRLMRWLRLAVFVAIPVATVAGQSGHPLSQENARDAFPPLFGTATEPSVRPLSLVANANLRGDLAWTFAFTEENGAGEAGAGGAAPAPDGSVCTVTLETLGSTSSGSVLARYAPDGTLQWEQAVPDLAGLYSADVAAVDAACVAVGAIYGTAGSSFQAVRADVNGISWIRTLHETEAGQGGGRTFVESDEAGGVWIGLSISGFPYGPALLIHLDAMGNDLIRVTRAASGAGYVTGVRAMDVFPDGRVAAVADADLLLIVEPEGAITSVPRDAAFSPTALAIDLTGTAPGIFVMGVGNGSAAEVRRFDLDGNLSWAKVLGASTIGVEFGSPFTVVVRDGDAFIAWPTSTVPQIARLRGSDGEVVWQAPLPEETTGARTDGLVLDDEGVVAWLELNDSYRVALDNNGALRWIEPEHTNTIAAPRSLAACGEGATCLIGVDYSGERPVVELAARDVHGDSLWTIRREGEASYYFFYDMALVPGGGVYLLGTTRTEEGGTDLLIAQFTPAGALAWAIAVDGGGTAEGSAHFTVLPEGDVVVAGRSLPENGEAQVLVTRIGVDGNAAWLTSLNEPEEIDGPWNIIGGDDRSVTLTYATFQNDISIYLTHLDEGGSVVWTVAVDPGDILIPRGLYGVADGYVLALQGYNEPTFSVRVNRYNTDGVVVQSDEIASVGECEVTPENAYADIDADGVVHASAQLSNGPSDCAGPAVFRFTPEGLVGYTYVSASDFSTIQALDTSPNGTVAAAYTNSQGWGMAVLDASGAELGGFAPGDMDMSIESVAVTQGQEVFASGFTSVAGSTGTSPRALSYTLDSGAEIWELPQLAGLSTQAPLALLAEDGTGYVAQTASSFGIRVFGVSRIDEAIPVGIAASPAPTDSGPLLQTIGPNPVRANATLGVHMAEAAKLSLFDMLGRRIATWEREAGAIEVTMPDVPSGVYVLHAESHATSAAIRLVVVE